MILAADPVDALLVNGGIIGIFFVLALLGWIWLKPSVDREFAKADTKDKQQQALIDTLLAVYHSEVLPTLADVDRRLIPLLENTQAISKRVETLLDRVEREWEWRERRGRVQDQEAYDRRSGSYEGRRGSSSGQGPSTSDHPSSEERS